MLAEFLIIQPTPKTYAIAKMRQGSRREVYVGQRISVRELESVFPGQEMEGTVEVLRVLSPLAASYYKMHTSHARTMQGVGMSPAPMDAAFLALIQDLMSQAA